MSNLIKALLFAGLFISQTLFAIPTGEPVPAKRMAFTKCIGLAESGPPPVFQLPGHVGDAECSAAATARYKDVYLRQINRNDTDGCPSKIVEDRGHYFFIQSYYNGGDGCYPDGDKRAASVTSRTQGHEEGDVCPPDGPANQSYTEGPYPNPDPTKTNQVCYAPAKPLGCGNLKGMATDSLKDYFLTKSDAYTGDQKPSCVTKCGKDIHGNTVCGNCKVVAKSWINAASGGGMTRWRPLVGTLTGESCGDKEQDTPPPEPPKCWQTTNNLKMCQQDPAEKCVSVNGVMKCEEGCGYVNGDFFCADKTPAPKPPKDKSDDKDVPDPDDTLPDPNKPIDQMVKKDFKDVQRGVETRLGAVSVGIGNLENSIDYGNQVNDQINDVLNESLDVQRGILSEVEKLGESSGDGDCDPLTDPNCSPPPCDPSKTDCEEFSTGVPKSWWNSKYPDGINSVFSEKRDIFLSSEAYAAMTGNGIGDGGGGAPTRWQICMPFGFADYGCHTLEISPAIWSFIRACILFGAAILCRRMLIGA